jgi:bifunctional DNA-binding transcriptional regulator/antitoxin component of YhaV-PrlF toxin-antitoxin module
MTFITVDRRGRATFPEEVRRALGLDSEEGNLVILEKTERGTYELVPAALVPRDQLWFHSDEVQAGVREGEADFREGRFAATESPEDAQALLDRLKQG